MSQTLQVILHGLKAPRLHLKLAVTVYLIQLSLAVVIGFQVYEVIEASIGHSLAVEDMISGYNHTVLRDLLNVHGASLSPLFGQMRWIILIYLIYSVFLHGGMLNVMILDKGDWSNFWNGGSRYFRPFLLVGAFFLMLLLIWSAIIFLPFLIGLFPLIESLDRESPIIFIAIALIIVWFVGVGWLFNWSFYSRTAFILHDKGIIKSIRRGFKVNKTLFLRSLSVWWIYALGAGAVYFVNFIFEQQIGISSAGLILFFLVWQQVAVFIKILIRISLYGSLVHLNRSIDEKSLLNNVI